MDIGKRIAHFRTAKGLTVNKLANLAGVSQSYLRDIELGNNNNPTIEILDCICTALDITLRDFFNADSTHSFVNDPLILEIYQLSPQQREQLRSFLHSMH